MTLPSRLLPHTSLQNNVSNYSVYNGCQSSNCSLTIKTGLLQIHISNNEPLHPIPPFPDIFRQQINECPGDIALDYLYRCLHLIIRKVISSLFFVFWLLHMNTIFENISLMWSPTNFMKAYMKSTLDCILSPSLGQKNESRGILTKFPDQEYDWTYVLFDNSMFVALYLGAKPRLRHLQTTTDYIKKNKNN